MPVSVNLLEIGDISHVGGCMCEIFVDRENNYHSHSMKKVVRYIPLELFHLKEQKNE